MSMEKDYIIHETHSRPITAIGSSSARREIYLGFEDGVIKSIEVDSGKHIQTYIEHKGWVTSFLYWPQLKLLFSASNDSVIVIIGPGGNVVDKIYIGKPVYCMAINERRKEMIFGVANGLQFHKMYQSRHKNHYLDIRPTSTVHEHFDIVRCVLTSDSHIYSAGYDGALVIYDCHYTGKDSAVRCFKNKSAHDAGISCMLVEKDTMENSTILITGSFDKTLKIWTNDGKLIHKFDGFLTSISGVCFIPKNKTVWCVAGTNSAYIYDPKSGENVTDFVDTFSEQTTEKYYLQLIRFLNDFNVLVTTTNRKQLIVFKYNPFGCLTSVKHKKPIDSICFTKKAPILIFTGDSEDIFKWEQMQSHQLIYSSEKLIKTENVTQESSALKGNKDHKSIEKLPDNPKTFGLKPSNKTILKLLFFEKLDYIIAACEDSSILIWGFDDDAVKILNNMSGNVLSDASEDDEDMKSEIKLKSKNFNENEFEVEKMEIEKEFETYHIKKAITRNVNDSVTNRVAGFKLKAILKEHHSCVTALAIVANESLFQTTYLLSAGWDRRICIWDLEKLRLFDVFRNKNFKSFDELEFASDGNILDICYCENTNCFGYSSADTMCYIRNFAIYGSEMSLINIFQGHKSEVNSIKWNLYNSTWATGGEDATIRIWSTDGVCIHIINCGGTVNCLCIDESQGSIIAAVHDTIKIYDSEEYRLVQTNVGHIDSIRDMILIQDRHSFVSVSWDKTIKVWRMWRKSSLSKMKVEVNKEKKFDNWVWDQLREMMKSVKSVDAV